MANKHSSRHKLWEIYGVRIPKIINDKAEITLGSREMKRNIIECYMQLFNNEILKPRGRE